jgi:hypothetical protein
MRIAKEVVCGKLEDVERLARENFDHQGYVIDEVLSIRDLGHNGRYRSWMVEADCTKKEAVDA